MTATAGDLVFVGGTNDRKFRAFNAKTGELLWEQKTNSGIMGMPVSYEVDGTQYIAIQSGWGVDAQRIQDALATNNIGIENNVPQGGVGLGVRASRSKRRADREAARQGESGGRKGPPHLRVRCSRPTLCRLVPGIQFFVPRQRCGWPGQARP